MANIPPELFQRIIENLCSAPELKKHDLGLCSLTCRYWAATIRPDIFRELTLRSRDDAIAFLQFIRPESTTTVASFGAYVQKLSLEQLIRPHGVPWMHLVALASGGGPPLLPKLSKVVVMLMGGDRTQSAFPTSIYADIPRSIPPSAIHPSELLLITGRFRRFEDILALSRSAPSSASMDFQSLSWDDVDRLTASSALTTRAMLWNRAPHSSSRTIRLRNCTAMWPLIWLTLGRPPPPLSPMGSSPRAPPLHRATSLIYVHPEELGRIARLVQAMQEACACLPVVAPNETERVKPCAEYEICSRTEGAMGHLDLNTSHGSSTSHKCCFTLSSQTGLVTAVEVQLQLPPPTVSSPVLDPLDHALRIDWRTCERLLRGFGPTLSSFKVTAWGAEDEVKLLASNLRDRMPEMTSSPIFLFEAWATDTAISISLNAPADAAEN